MPHGWRLGDSSRSLLISPRIRRIFIVCLLVRAGIGCFLLLLLLCIEGDVFAIEGVVDGVVEVYASDVDFRTERFESLLFRLGVNVGCVGGVFFATEKTVEVFGS